MAVVRYSVRSGGDRNSETQKSENQGFIDSLSALANTGKQDWNHQAFSGSWSQVQTGQKPKNRSEGSRNKNRQDLRRQTGGQTYSKADKHTCRQTGSQMGGRWTYRNQKSCRTGLKRLVRLIKSKKYLALNARAVGNLKGAGQVKALIAANWLALPRLIQCILTMIVLAEQEDLALD